MIQTSSKDEASDTNTNDATPYHIHSVCLKFLINSVPRLTRTEGNGIEFRIVYNRVESNETDRHAESGAEARRGSMSSGSNLASSLFIYVHFKSRGVVD